MTTQQLTAVAKNYEVWDEDKTPFRKVLRLDAATYPVDSVLTFLLRLGRNAASFM